MRRTLVVALLAVATGAQAAERSFPVSAFDRLAARGSPTVNVVTGRAPGVTATGDERDLDRLEITVVNGELRTGLKPSTMGWRWGGTPLVITVTVPSLRAVALAGSGDVNVDRVATPGFTGALAGSGDLNLPNVNTGDMSLSLAGSGDIRAAGRCRQATLKLAGSGDLRAEGLRCESVRAELAGSGDLNAYASRAADVSLVGSGDVTVAGGARCTQAKRGSGTVRC